MQSNGQSNPISADQPDDMLDEAELFRSLPVVLRTIEPHQFGLQLLQDVYDDACDAYLEESGVIDYLTALSGQLQELGSGGGVEALLTDPFTTTPSATTTVVLNRHGSGPLRWGPNARKCDTEQTLQLLEDRSTAPPAVHHSHPLAHLVYTTQQYRLLHPYLTPAAAASNKAKNGHGVAATPPPSSFADPSHARVRLYYQQVLDAFSQPATDRVMPSSSGSSSRSHGHEGATKDESQLSRREVSLVDLVARLRIFRQRPTTSSGAKLPQQQQQQASTPAEESKEPQQREDPTVQCAGYILDLDFEADLLQAHNRLREVRSTIERVQFECRTIDDEERNQAARLQPSDPLMDSPGDLTDLGGGAAEHELRSPTSSSSEAASSPSNSSSNGNTKRGGTTKLPHPYAFSQPKVRSAVVGAATAHLLPIPVELLAAAADAVGLVLRAAERSRSLLLLLMDPSTTWTSTLNDNLAFLRRPTTGQAIPLLFKELDDSLTELDRLLPSLHAFPAVLGVATGSQLIVDCRWTAQTWREGQPLLLFLQRLLVQQVETFQIVMAEEGQGEGATNGNHSFSSASAASPAVSVPVRQITTTPTTRLDRIYSDRYSVLAWAALCLRRAFPDWTTLTLSPLHRIATQLKKLKLEEKRPFEVVMHLLQPAQRQDVSGAPSLVPPSTISSAGDDGPWNIDTRRVRPNVVAAAGDTLGDFLQELHVAWSFETRHLKFTTATVKRN